MANQISEFEVREYTSPLYELTSNYGLSLAINVVLVDFDAAVFPEHGRAKSPLENGSVYAVNTEDGRVVVDRVSHEKPDIHSPWHSTIEDRVRVRGLDSMVAALALMNNFEFTRVLEVEKDWKGTKTATETFTEVTLSNNTNGQEYYRTTQQGEMMPNIHEPSREFRDAPKFVTMFEELQGGDLHSLGLHRAAAMAIACAHLAIKDPNNFHLLSRRVGADLSSGRPKKFSDPYPIRTSVPERLSTFFRSINAREIDLGGRA